MDEKVHQFPRQNHKRPGQTFLGTSVAHVEELGPHANMTAQEALSVVLRENPPNVLIIYQYEDGETFVRSSAMSSAEANFFLDKAKQQVLNGIT